MSDFTYRVCCFLLLFRMRWFYTAWRFYTSRCLYKFKAGLQPWWNLLRYIFIANSAQVMHAFIMILLFNQYIYFIFPILFIWVVILFCRLQRSWDYWWFYSSRYMSQSKSTLQRWWNLFRYIVYNILCKNEH